MDLGLDKAGVELTPHYAVKVDEYSRSTVPSIYAVGDVTNRANLTPVAIREGHAFADTVFGGKDVKVDHALVPTAVFSQPEIGTVGLTEAEARAAHAAVAKYRSRGPARDFHPAQLVRRNACPVHPTAERIV